MAHHLQRIFTILALGATLVGPLVAEGSGVQWQFYGDFDVTAILSDDANADPTFTFQQNHTTLFVTSPPDSPVNLMADVLHPGDLFQFSFAAGPGTLTLGRALVPFGTFDYHHLYGGRQDDSGVFLPKLWSDYGLVYAFSPLGAVTPVFFLMNGMDPAGFQDGGLTPRVDASASIDADLAKVVGGQLRFDVDSGLFAVGSASWQPGLAMGGLDASWDVDSWVFKAGGIVQAVSGTADYVRWADYFEVKWKFDWTMDLRFRGGQMDTNSTYITAEDQANLNVGLVWKQGSYELDLVYFRNFTLADPALVGYASNYHQILLKVLVSL